MNVEPNPPEKPQSAKKQRRSQSERTEATRAALMAAARRLFTERGYDDVGTEEIVRAAGVTRGALYHHFGGKAELLEAVYERLEAESTERVARVVLGSDLHSPLEAMKAGIEAFLDECAEPELQRIALHDAPAVLGWDRWREIAAANGLGLIEASLAAAIEAGEIRALPVKPLAHLLLGALDEAAMLIARDDDPAARAEVTAVLLALLESFAVVDPA
ncbi:MAG TPA: TetR/AcrR family transcriptional regulator [Solirubrobacterales bacterium]|jgi:AcrR family transcriptional regulator|nr:TetR/AcrR family transcriptional regulator [Solirubrobacterales bacterium]